jgi:hypothetical protein
MAGEPIPAEVRQHISTVVAHQPNVLDAYVDRNISQGVGLPTQAADNPPHYEESPYGTVVWRPPLRTTQAAGSPARAAGSSGDGTPHRAIVDRRIFNQYPWSVPPTPHQEQERGRPTERRQADEEPERGTEPRGRRHKAPRRESYLRVAWFGDETAIITTRSGIAFATIAGSKTRYVCGALTYGNGMIVSHGF